MPLFIKPACAKSVRRCGQESHIFAPASFATKANAVNASGTVCHFRGCIRQESPCWRVWHFKSSFVHQVFAVHHERALAIERRCIEFAVYRQAANYSRQNILGVINASEWNQPTFFAPDWGFVHTNGQHVILAALGGNIFRHFLTQVVFFQSYPIQLDVWVGLGEIVGHLLHRDHVTVVHSGNGQSRFSGKG